MIVYPNAKINIGLNVVEKRPDGYHNLETVFYPINLQDVLDVKELDPQDMASAAGAIEEGYTLKVTGTVLDGAPEDNLVVRAFKLLKQDFDLPPVGLGLYKHIPTGAGLGGGSSDAAFTIKTLNERFLLGLTDTQMEAYCARLGADCAFFIKNRPVFATGIGNVFQSIALSLKGRHLVLVKPDIFVSTKDAYAKVRVEHPERHLPELLAQPIETWKETVRNDFEPSVFSKYPEIAAIKDLMYDLGAVYASMSGSGSSVFGIFDEPVENVDEKFCGMFCRQRALD